MSTVTYKGFPTIVNGDGKPFPDYGSADFLRDQLAKIAPEYGFTVQDVPTGGFVVVQSVKVGSPQTTPETAPSNTWEGKERRTNPRSASVKVAPEVRHFAESLPLVLHPAWRNYLFRWAIVLLLMALAYSTNFLIGTFVPPEWLAIAYQKVPRLNRFAEGTVWLLALYHFFYIFKEIYTNTYTVTRDGLKHRTGIVARDAHSIKYRDIRGVNLRQDVFDRLLGVGTLEFHTAGSDEAEVIFARITRPAYLRDIIDAYAALFRQNRD